MPSFSFPNEMEILPLRRSSLRSCSCASRFAGFAITLLGWPIMTIRQCLRQRIQSWVSRRPANVDSVRGFNTSRGPSPRRPDGLARKNIKAPHAARAAARHHHPHRRSFGLSPRANAENFHRVSSGRNCRDPFTRLRNTRVAFHHVTHFLCGVDRGLWLRAYDYVLARIRSKCRCAKRECEKDAHASNRPAAQATWSACCFHTLIVMPDRISCKQRWLTAPNGSFFEQFGVLW